MMTVLGTILVFLSFALFITACVGLFAPARVELSSRWQSVPIWVTSVIVLAIGGSMLPDDPDSTTSTPEDQTWEDQTWVVHDYRIIPSDTDPTLDTSRAARIHVLAPTAVTREARLATLAHATSQVYREYYTFRIFAHLVLHEGVDSGENIRLANLRYEPDVCDGLGDDCTGEIWSGMSASDAQFTNEQIEYRQAWDAHAGRFYRDYEDDAEARLTEFLAQEFEVTVEHLSDQVRHVSEASFAGSERMELPDALINFYALTRDDQDVRDDAREEIEERYKGFHCLSSWDGNHGGMTELIKARLNDPDSMETRETLITPVNNAGQHRITVNFTARNAFGGVVRNRAFGLVDNEMCEATITSIE